MTLRVTSSGYYVQMDTWIRTVLVIIASGLVWFVGAWQADALISSRGVLSPTILQSINPVYALISVVITIGVGSSLGGLVARISSTTTGMFVFGLSLVAMAMKLHGAEEFILSSGSYYILMLESVLLSVLVLLGTLVVFGLSGRKQIRSCFNCGSGLEQFGKAVLISLVILPVIWFIANTPAKVQVLGAAALGGVLVGILARQFLQSAQPIMLFVLPIAIGGLGYFVGIMVGDSDIVALNQQSISRLLLPMPLDYAAGIIIGLALVLGWTSSVEEKTSAEAHKKFDS